MCVLGWTSVYSWFTYNIDLVSFGYNLIFKQPLYFGQWLTIMLCCGMDAANMHCFIFKTWCRCGSLVKNHSEAVSGLGFRVFQESIPFLMEVPDKFQSDIKTRQQGEVAYKNGPLWRSRWCLFLCKNYIWTNGQRPTSFGVSRGSRAPRGVFMRTTRAESLWRDSAPARSGFASGFCWGSMGVLVASGWMLENIVFFCPENDRWWFSTWIIPEVRG